MRATPDDAPSLALRCGEVVVLDGAPGEPKVRAKIGIALQETQLADKPC